MRRRVFLLFLTLLPVVLALLPGCSTPPAAWPEGKSPRVLASFPPLYCFASNLVGDNAAVLSLLTSTGPHDYHVTPQDPIKVRGADLFVINGLGLDDTFTRRLKDSSDNLKLRFVELGEAIPPPQLRKLTEADRHDHHGHSHAHGLYDPHVWLGIPEAIAMVKRLREELKKIDPAHAADYDRRAKAYVEKLNKLHEDGKKQVSRLKPEDRRLITMHDSLYYFARSFDLTIVESIQPRAGVELDANQMAKLVNLCQKQDVRLITVEPQYPKNAAETLRNEVFSKAKRQLHIVEIDTLETDDPEDKIELNTHWYEAKMRKNLQNLTDALQ